MNPNRFSTVLDDMIRSSFSDIHTILPAKVTAVDYSTGYAEVSPLVKNYIGVNKSQAYPSLSNVPLVILSGNSGKARITFPVTAGDIVIVLFSERDPTTVLNGGGKLPAEPVQTSPLGLYPIGVIPCIFTQGSAQSISDTDVVLENDKSHITLKATGEISMTNDSGSFSMASDGAVNINGLKITSDGKLIDSTGVQLDTHIHSGVQSGGSNTGTPVV